MASRQRAGSTGAFYIYLIRRKLSAAVDGACSVPADNARTFVLFLPEDETHELLLLFTEYILRKNNERVIYLGASLPIPELGFIANTFKPYAWITYLTVPVSAQYIQQFLSQLSGIAPKAKVIVGGAQIVHYQLQVPKNVKLVTNARQLKAHIQ